MNPIVESLNQRKSVRVYENKPISEYEKQIIFNAAIQAPTAGNMTLYTILDITDSAIKEKLSVSCDNQPFIATAPLVLIFCADYYRWYRMFKRHVHPLRAPAEGDLILANADAIIAAQNAVVAAESLGIGSCYIGDIVEHYEFHRELLQLPDYVFPACMVCFGYPTQQQKERVKPTRFQISEIVHENGYQLGKADKMENMLISRNEITEPELADWVNKFCQRKWNSDFSVEMSRSCREIISSWCKKEDS